VSAHAIAPSRRTLRFRLVLFAWLAPILLLGFGASGVANRTIFAGWALLAAAVYWLVVWYGFRRGWGGWLLGGRVLLVLAAATALLARIVAREHGELDLGLRSFFPAIYDPRLSDPRSAVYLAIFLSVCGVLSILISHGAASVRRLR
jgi:hypothetical protein